MTECELSDSDVPPAYNRQRDQSFTFDETVTIETEENADFATITVETFHQTISFEVRITNYTTRFGTLDVSHMTIGAYSLDLYHSKPETDTYFVRKLFYYGDVDGIDGERTRDDASTPYSPVWSRDDMGSRVVVTNDSTHLRVYDWRQNMLTHGKPTPESGEIVLQYQSSLEAGGNRKEIEMVLQSEFTTVTGDHITLDLLTITDAGYVGYGSNQNGDWWRVTIPISSERVTDKVSIEPTTKPHTRTLETLVWTRHNADSWAICQDQTTTQYI